MSGGGPITDNHSITGTSYLIYICSPLSQDPNPRFKAEIIIKLQERRISLYILLPE